MSEKGLLRFKHKNGQGLMNYLIEGEHIITITTKDSKKVSVIKDSRHIDLNFKKLGGTFTSHQASILADETEVKKYYDLMIAKKNAHFKKGHENLVVLKMHR